MRRRFRRGRRTLSVVVSDRFDAIGERQKDASARPHDEVCALVRELGELGVFDLRSTCDMMMPL